MKPDAPWDLAGIDRRLLAWRLTRANGGFANDEGFLIGKAETLPDGMIRIALKGPAPFIMSWHQLFRTDGKWAVNREIRKHDYRPYYAGLKITFPRKGNKTFTLKKVDCLPGTQIPCSTLETVEDMAAAGIGPGDWFYVWGFAPGQRVRVSRVAAE